MKNRHFILSSFVLFVSLLVSSNSVYAGEQDSLFQFAMITDVHQSSPSADIRLADKNVIQFVEYCNQHPELEFAYFGGDFFNAYDTDHLQALWCMERAHYFFDKLTIPFYTAKGNHDCNGKRRKPDRTPDNSQIITDHEYYEFWSPLSEKNPLRHPEGIVVNAEDPEGNYYYRDFPKQKIRMIMLNDYDLDSMEVFGYHGKQLKWICEEALNLMDKVDRKEWGVVLFGHYFVGKPSKYAIDRILSAFQTGNDISERDHHIRFTGSFKEQGPMQLIGCIHGHVHCDIYNNHAGYNVIGCTRGFATDGEENTNDEICFDHFVINTRAKTIEEHRFGRDVSRVFRYDSACMVSPVKIYPGVEGTGRFTVGGTGGRVLVVKSLKDNGKRGTLRWAVEQEGARIVRFAVKGTIKLKAPLYIKNDSITIEGQTAPKNGEIILTGHPVAIEASEAVVRYLTIRPGAMGEVLEATEGECGGLLIGREDRKQHHIVLEHLTVADAHGDLFSAARCRDITVQKCRFENSLDGKGVLFGGFRSSYVSNYLLGLQTHCPLFSSTDGDQKWVDLQDNVFENWGTETATGGGHHGTINMTYNFYLSGENSTCNYMLQVHPDGTGRYYVDDNWWDGKLNNNNWEMVKDRSGVPYIVASQDSALWLSLDPIMRPSTGQFAKTCLAIAMTPIVPMEDESPLKEIAQLVRMYAGNKREDTK